MAEKERADVALVKRGLCESREKAQANIMAGLVYIGQRKVLKASDPVKPEDELILRGKANPFVSRGGLKLEKAIAAFDGTVSGRVCMDIGAAAGGFTDVLLKNGATHVYAIDVGYGQFDWGLRNDSRVTLMERTNARYLTAEQFPLHPTMTVMDVSFISIKLILPVAAQIMGPQGCFYTLVKPQFEVGRDRVGKKVKKRIIQQLAVMALNRKQYGSILLFVGAPGTGKTSIGQSIARALGREYVRISLGGIRDEAEIRGHRRTYIGAMPGRIMEGMKRSGVSNPVMVLDEVDKLAKDYGGDPASALLEVLDPEQNNTFTDHYMNVPYDLSNVLFVCTANTADTIPEALLNRMEVISFPGYTAVEKYQIARKHLIPKAMETMGIQKNQLKISDSALRRIIEEYTMESGVRDLKKNIETLCRTAAVQLVKGSAPGTDSDAPASSAASPVSITKNSLTEYLGRPALHRERRLTTSTPGVVTGLAWTRAGGEILFIESRLTKGKGRLTITGQLGDVMKESVQIALTLVKSLYPKECKVFEDHDLHIHVPAGAVPKDGPSAGITLVTALASLITGRPADPDSAMTGEVSLRGGVMPIGGLPEKLMAAQRAGIKRVFIPYDNVEDLEDVAEEVKEKLTIVPVKKVNDVLKAVLE